MWSTLLIAAGVLVVVLLLAWRFRRYQRDVGDSTDGAYRPPLFHDRAGPH